MAFDNQTIHFEGQPHLTCTSMDEGHHSMSVNLHPLVHFSLFLCGFFSNSLNVAIIEGRKI